jgi:hypothetical protein
VIGRDVWVKGGTLIRCIKNIPQEWGEPSLSLVNAYVEKNGPSPECKSLLLLLLLFLFLLCVCLCWCCVLLCSALISVALHCVRFLLCVALLRFVFLCCVFALICCALIWFALLCFVLLCCALLKQFWRFGDLGLRNQGVKSQGTRGGPGALGEPGANFTRCKLPV